MNIIKEKNNKNIERKEVKDINRCLYAIPGPCPEWRSCPRKDICPYVFR